MSSAWTQEDRIRFLRNEGVQKSMEFLKEGRPQRAYLEMVTTFRTQARYAGLLWDYGLNPITKEPR